MHARVVSVWQYIHSALPDHVGSEARDDTHGDLGLLAPGAGVGFHVRLAS
jgi:hypothetical protein